MTRYMILFDDGDMDFPREDLPEVAKAAHAVEQEAMRAGVWVYGAGLEHQDPSVVATDGTVTDASDNKAYIGGVTIVDVPSREDALQWAGKIAVARRCAQEFREIMPDPAVGN